jgi:hypothetical protein
LLTLFHFYCPGASGRSAGFLGDNRGRCVNYFTLRTSIIWMETIKDLYISAAQLGLTVERFEARCRNELEPAFDKVTE